MSKDYMTLKMPYVNAPEISVSKWLQGGPTKISDMMGKYILLHFFQQNCPGCFLSSLPATEYIHRRYGGDRLEVVGISSRFEEFDVNTEENTRKFLEHGTLTDHVKDAIKKYHKEDNYLDKMENYKFKINHRIGWDEGAFGEPSKTLSAYVEEKFVTPYECLIDDGGKIILSDPHLSAGVAFHHLISKITGIDVEFEDGIKS